MSFDVIRGVADLFAQGNEEDQRKAFQINNLRKVYQCVQSFKNSKFERLVLLDPSETERLRTRRHLKVVRYCSLFHYH